MREIRSILFFLLCSLLISCNTGKQKENRIMVTIEPQRYFAEQLAAPLFSIETLVPGGNSPETYDPTPDQMIKLSHCKAYFAVGELGFEKVWMKRIQDNFPDLHFFRTDGNIDPIRSEIDHGDHKHEGVDPHIWSSPKEAGVMIQNMYEALVLLDPDNKETYTANLQKLQDRISSVDEEVRKYLADSQGKSFIIYHPALSYFARDYGLNQYCIETDGKEPSPRQLKDLIRIVQEAQIRTIFVQEEFDRKNAETIAGETGCRLVVINPLSYDWTNETLKIAKALADE